MGQGVAGQVDGQGAARPPVVDFVLQLFEGGGMRVIVVNGLQAGDAATFVVRLLGDMQVQLHRMQGHERLARFTQVPVPPLIGPPGLLRSSSSSLRPAPGWAAGPPGRAFGLLVVLWAPRKARPAGSCARFAAHPCVTRCPSRTTMQRMGRPDLPASSRARKAAAIAELGIGLLQRLSTRYTSGSSWVIQASISSLWRVRVRCVQS